MIVYRLSKSMYANDLSGKGAMLAGGRWNSRRVPMVYTAASRALCVVEIAVHTPLGIIPADYTLVTIALPDQAVVELDIALLPSDWNVIPHADSTQQIGDQFVKDGKYLAMKVPAVVVPGEFNYLINPAHADAGGVKVKSVEQFGFDLRLFEQ